MPEWKEREVVQDTIDGEDVVHVELTQDQWALLNADDWHRIAETYGSLWSAASSGSKYRAVKSVSLLSGRQKAVPLGHAVMQPAQGQRVMSINKDTLDARRSNLQVLGTPSDEPDPLSIPKCLATEADIAEAERLKPAQDTPESKTPSASKRHTETTQGTPTGSAHRPFYDPDTKYRKAAQRPERLARLYARLADARRMRRSVDDEDLTPQQRRRSYLTRKEHRHAELVDALKRAEGRRFVERRGGKVAGIYQTATGESIPIKARVSP